MPDLSVSRATEPISSFIERPDLRPIYDDYRRRLLARNYALVASIPWHFAPPTESAKKDYAKKLVKGALKCLVSWLPCGAKTRLKRLAQFVVQNS